MCFIKIHTCWYSISIAFFYSSAVLSSAPNNIIQVSLFIVNLAGQVANFICCYDMNNKHWVCFQFNS